MKQKSGMSAEKRNNLIFYICFMAIPIAQFAIFYIGVNFQSILMAFQSFDNVTEKTTWIGLANIWEEIKKFMEHDGLVTLKNSLILFLVKLGIGTPLGLLFSYYIYKKFRWYSFYRVMLFIPSIVPSIVLVLMFKYMGLYVWPQLVGAVTGADPTTITGLFSVEKAWGSLLFYNIWVSFGTTVLLYVDAMTNISPDVVEAAELDGATGIKEFFYITLPSAYPTVVTFIIINIANFFIDQAHIFSYFSYSPIPGTETVGYQLYKEIYYATKNSNYAAYRPLAARGIVLTLVTVPVTLVVRWLLNKVGPSEE